jgi:hypothetical protein
MRRPTIFLIDGMHKNLRNVPSVGFCMCRDDSGGEMFNRFIMKARCSARQKASQSAEWAIFAGSTVRRFLTTAHHTVMLLGLTAIAALALMFVRPDVTDQLKALSPFGVAIVQSPEVAGLSPGNLMDSPATPIAPGSPQNVASLSTDQVALLGTAREQQRVTNWLSRRYRVAGDATDMLVSATYLTAKDLKLDPLLILAVMAIESGFNPFAESAMGAQGLMQVMSKVHHEKFQDLGGIKAALNPVANIRVGSLILKDYVTRGGSVEAGLKQYVGAAAFESDSGYGNRVLAEYRRLKEVAAGKAVPMLPGNAVTVMQKPQRAESATPSKPDAPVGPGVESESASVNLPGSRTGQLAAL